MTIPFTPYENDANGTALPPVLLRRVDELEAQVRVLTERVAVLEAAPAAPPRDELNEKLLAFLRSHPGLKFTGQLVAENIGEPPSSVYGRLRTLARHGHLVFIKEDGRNGLFYTPADTDQQ